MEFVKLNGWLENGSDFISIEIKNGDRRNSIGDQAWISNDGKELQIYAYSDDEVLETIMNVFKGDSRRSFKGAMLRMGVVF